MRSEIKHTSNCAVVSSCTGFFPARRFPAFLYSLMLAELVILLLLTPGPASAQSKKKTAKPRSATSTSLPGGQQCDGALEVIPRKEMTFTRKRRPSPVVDKQ